MTAQPVEIFDAQTMPDLLLVEDNPLHIRLVKSMLLDIWPEPNELRTARKLSSAVEELKAARPDCILLDLLLPDADGLEAVNALLAVDHTAPIVVLSSHDDDRLAVQAIREGAQDYLVKGTVGPEILARSIRFAIHRHRMDRVPVLEAAPLPTIEGLASAGAAIVDATGRLIHVQADVAAMLGVEVETLVGSDLGELCHPNDAAAWSAALDRSGSDHELSLRLRHPSGNDLQVRLELTPLLGSDGDVSAFLSRWYPHTPEGTASSGTYAVVSEWVGG